MFVATYSFDEYAFTDTSFWKLSNNATISGWTLDASGGVTGGQCASSVSAAAIGLYSPGPNSSTNQSTFPTTLRSSTWMRLAGGSTFSGASSAYLLGTQYGTPVAPIIGLSATGKLTVWSTPVGPGAGASTLLATVGPALTDGQWHCIEVEIANINTVTVGGASIHVRLDSALLYSSALPLAANTYGYTGLYLGTAGISAGKISLDDWILWNDAIGVTGQSYEFTSAIPVVPGGGMVLSTARPTTDNAAPAANAFPLLGAASSHAAVGQVFQHTNNPGVCLQLPDMTFTPPPAGDNWGASVSYATPVLPVNTKSVVGIFDLAMWYETPQGSQGEAMQLFPKIENSFRPSYPVQVQTRAEGVLVSGYGRKSNSAGTAFTPATAAAADHGVVFTSSGHDAIMGPNPIMSWYRDFVLAYVLPIKYVVNCVTC